MNYTNFVKRITIPHQIVVKGWPIPKFCSPSDITSKTDVETVLKAFKSGEAYFEKLSTEDHKRVVAAYYASEADGNENDSVPTPAVNVEQVVITPAADNTTTQSQTTITHSSEVEHLTYNASTAPSPSHLSPAVDSRPVEHPDPDLAPPPAKRQKSDADRSPFQLLQFVVGDNGEALTAHKRPRKKRCDAGQKRGPYAKGTQTQGARV